MEQIHKFTKDFMITAGQVVRETPSIPTVEEMELRLSLEYEELLEKAVLGMGLGETFMNIIDKVNERVAKKLYKEDHEGAYKTDTGYFFQDTNKVNLVEVFDASCDQDVVKSGTDLAFGMQHIIPEGMREVYRSNMSKFDETSEDADSTYQKYDDEGLSTHAIEVNGKWVTRRDGDNKILKSYKYSPADLGIILYADKEG